MNAITYLCLGMCNKLPIVNTKTGENLLWAHLLHPVLAWLFKVSEQEPKYSHLVLMENCYFIMWKLSGLYQKNEQATILCKFSHDEMKRKGFTEAISRYVK